MDVLCQFSLLQHNFLKLKNRFAKPFSTLPDLLKHQVRKIRVFFGIGEAEVAIEIEFIEKFHPRARLKDDEIKLNNLVARTRGQNHGEEALTFITDLAEKFGIAICLQALGDEDCPISDDRLACWYEKFGFEEPRGDTNIMWREPQKKL